MEKEQQLLMLFETNAALETQKFNNSNKKQALVEEQDRTTRLLSLNSKLYQTTELMNPSRQNKENIKHPAPCDLNKSRYAANDLPNKKNTRKSQKDDCLPPKKPQIEKIKKITSSIGTEKNTLTVKPEDDPSQQAMFDSMVSNGSELKSDTQSSIISNPSPISETRSSFTFPRSPKDSDDKGSQTADHDELMHYWSCENCFGEKLNKNSNLPALKGGGFGFMGTGMDYQVSDKPKIEIDICPPLKIVQPTFNDFYEVDADWLEESAQCPYDDLLIEDNLSTEDESQSHSIMVDPCENKQSMSEWERCLAGCCEEAICNENDSQVSYDYQCGEEFIVCNDDDCEI